MRFYNETIEKLLRRFGFIKATDYEVIDGIPEVKVSRRQRLIDWYNEKKIAHVVKKEEEALKYQDMMGDLAKIYLEKEQEKIEKRDRRIASRDAKRRLKRRLDYIKSKEKLEKREEKITNFVNSYIEKKEAKSVEREEKKEAKLVKKEEKRLAKEERKQTENKALVSSNIKCVFEGALTCLSAAGALMAAASVFTIGFVPALVSTGILVGSYKIFNHFFKQDIKENLEIRKEAKLLDSGLTNNEGEHLYMVSPKEIKEKMIDVASLVVGNDVMNVKLSRELPATQVKLTREEKIAKVKSECKLARVRINSVTSYCMFVAKDDIKLQKFIRSEYKKQNPEEKVQSFDMGDKKVLVLNNRPIFK